MQFLNHNAFIGGPASPVGHVILFDWPRDPAEFLRRVGRTARAGAEGKCTALVVGRQVKVEQKIHVRQRASHCSCVHVFVLGAYQVCKCLRVAN